MNHKKGLLPRLAIMGIRKNASTYMPYIGISIFAIFTYFVFDLILNNDVVLTVPRAQYAVMLMQIGFVLLSIIMVPFLYYTNSFLIKRRKKELGLYSILGMEKKHIGMMMLLESIVIYIIVIVSAVCLGLLFSKLIFLLLLNLAGLPVNAQFSFSLKAFKDTAIFYALICLINLTVNLIQVGISNPAELMSDAKKGEKEVKHTFIWSVLGIFCLGWGYYLALKAQLNSMIFTDFFLAVFLVVVGTYFLFTSGSVAFLKGLKKNRRFYYREENFITVSGMLYRMKKSAASLSNICIFGTMAVVTVICTVSLYFGIPGMKHFVFPYDMEASFLESQFGQKDSWKEEVDRLASEEGVVIEEKIEYSYVRLSMQIKDSLLFPVEKVTPFEDRHIVELITLEVFNELEGTSYELNEGEILLYSTGPDFAGDSLQFSDRSFRVREELMESIIEPKTRNNTFGWDYKVVVQNSETLSEIAALYGVDSTQQMIWKTKMNLNGSDEQIAEFASRTMELSSGMPGFSSLQENTEASKDMEAMYGGLLFIGIFYGIIFFMCLLIIMYYKQITEGFEDQKNFDIMQKVGMSDEEVRRTIKKQILLVFFLPLFGALMHTAAGMKMVIMMFGSLQLFQTGLILLCTLGVCAVFALVYIICYHRTARTYYRIVRRMAV